jgi:hypothetical protein
MEWTAVTGQIWDLMVRRTDDNNCWIVRADQTNSTIKLFEKSGGTETERATASFTWTNGQAFRILVFMEGNTIKVNYTSIEKLSYTSASFNNTATGVKTTRGGSNLVAWPRSISGSALTELNRHANP